MMRASRRRRRSMRTVNRRTERGPRWWEHGTPPPPAAGAIVMATGIESIVLGTAGQPVLSELLLWMAVAAWIALAALLAASVARGASQAARVQARSPAALTAVAATCVIGTRVAARAPAAGVAALALALDRLGGAPVAGLATLADADERHRVHDYRVDGSARVLCAAIADANRSPWLVVAGAAFAAAGIAAYPLVISTFDPRQLLTGHGDQWVAGGALAIAALATADLATSARGLSFAAWSAHLLEAASVVLGAAAAGWLPSVLAGEIARPRLRYDLRRWATVFPVAMYSAAGTAVGRLAGSDALVRLSRGWSWVAFAVWAAVSVGMLRRGLEATG
jgi:tellurite resistance protein TehA-like permease